MLLKYVIIFHQSDANMANGWVRVKSIGLRIKKGHFKWVRKWVGSIGLWVNLGRVDPYFSHEFFFFFLRKQHVFAIRKVT